MRVVLSGNLRRYTEFESDLEFTVHSVSDALSALVERFPGLDPVVYDGDRKLRSVLRLYVNGDLLANGDTDHALEPNDELGILTAIAGG
jgi:molybdopterin converting factor small subunit